MEEIIAVSIIVPVYNVERYLEECLKSIVEQVNEDIEKQIEVILINDGSTDGSEIICQKYCEKYDYCYMYSQENQGVSSARNKGITHAKGRYLFFLDSDDYMTDILQELIMVISKANNDFIFGKKDWFLEQFSRYVKSNMDLDPIKESDSLTSVYEKLYDTYEITVSLIIIKREFLIEQELFFKEGIYHEDELWATMVFVCAESVCLFNKSVYCYRVGREGSIMNSFNIQKGFDLLAVADDFDYIIKNSEIGDKRINVIKNRRSFLEWCVIQSLGEYRNDPLGKELKKEARKRIKYLKYGKYKLAYYAINVLGIDIVRKCNVLRVSIIDTVKKVRKTGYWNDLL